MTSTRRTTSRRRRRRRDRWSAFAVFVLAIVAGLVAAHFGTHRAWENPTTTTTVQSQGGK
ncbi:MAG TPA: hypothetical protein VN636_09760 [Acidimicrobiia bacterium]|nr:hypothetical protein [Acidimicrobiia bacterium]